VLSKYPARFSARNPPALRKSARIPALFIYAIIADHEKELLKKIE